MISTTILLLLLFLIISHKTIPFAYVVRFYYQCIRGLGPSLFIPATENYTTYNTFKYAQPQSLFKSVTLHSRVSPLELDMYLHKSNSTYFLDLDIARTKLLTRIVQPFWWFCYENKMGKYGKGRKREVGNFPYVPVATVQCQFKKELKPLQKFDISSRILAWDKKWLFVLSVFTTTNGKRNKKVNAIALTKYVFKNGRTTIPPEEILKHCNLLDEKNEAVNKVNFELVKNMVDTEDLETLAAEAL